MPSASAGSQASNAGSDSASTSNSAGQSGSQSAAGAMPGVSASLPGRSQSPADTGPNGENGEQAGSSSAGQGDQGGRDLGTGASGQPGGQQSGASGSSGSVLGSPSGDYSLDTLPDGVLSGRSGREAGSAAGDGAVAGSAGAGRGTEAMTTTERAAVLDEQLRRGYEAFDGFILGERERAQAETNAGGAGAQPGEEAGAGGSSAAGPQILNGGGVGPQVATQAPPMPGGQTPTETFPPPEDIPSGRDDDVVARQLREAAMSEPDPELREALWDEYRNYTGLSDN